MSKNNSWESKEAGKAVEVEVKEESFITPQPYVEAEDPKPEAKDPKPEAKEPKPEAKLEPKVEPKDLKVQKTQFPTRSEAREYAESIGAGLPVLTISPTGANVWEV